MDPVVDEQLSATACRRLYHDLLQALRAAPSTPDGGWAFVRRLATETPACDHLRDLSGLRAAYAGYLGGLPLAQGSERLLPSGLAQQAVFHYYVHTEDHLSRGAGWVHWLRARTHTDQPGPDSAVRLSGLLVRAGWAGYLGWALLRAGCRLVPAGAARRRTLPPGAE